MGRNGSGTLAMVVLVGMLVAGLTSARPAGATGSDIDIKNLAYSPSTIQVVQGDMVTWTNSEEIMPHDVTSGAIGQPDVGQRFGSEIMLPGQTFSATFPEPGEYVYLCKLHPAMTGVVIVLPN